jgi:electron transfer flavoprotein beta subunit
VGEDLLTYLRAHVRRRGLSLRRLAAAAGVSHSTLSRLLRGRQTPSAEVLAAVARELGVPLPELFERAGLGSAPAAIDLRTLGVPLVVPHALLEAELQRLAALPEEGEVGRALTAGYAAKRRAVAADGPVAEHLDALHRLALDPRAPDPVRRLARAAILYFVLGRDRIPDQLFAVGFLDDAWVVERVWREVAELRTAQAESRRTEEGVRLALHAVVCLKRILDPEISAARFRIDPETQDAQVADAPHVMGPYDENALEVALQLKDASPETRVTVLSVGPPEAEEILRKALSSGADDAVRVEAGSGPVDPLRVAAILAAAVRRMGDVALVLLGLQSGAWDSGETPFALAEHLGAASVGMAGGVTATESGFTVRRVLEAAEEEVSVPAPAVLSVTNDGRNALRMAKVRDILAAKRKPVETVALADLAVAVEERRQVVEVRTAQQDRRPCEFIEAPTDAEKGRLLARRLRQLGLV